MGQSSESIVEGIVLNPLKTKMSFSFSFLFPASHIILKEKACSASIDGVFLWYLFLEWRIGSEVL